MCHFRIDEAGRRKDLTGSTAPVPNRMLFRMRHSAKHMSLFTTPQQSW